MVCVMSGSAPRRRRAPPRITARVEAGAPEGGGEDERGPAVAGDLFAHFGVELDGGRGQPAPIVDGRACVGCGWLLRAQVTEPCPLCGRPREGE